MKRRKMSEKELKDTSDTSHISRDSAGDSHYTFKILLAYFNSFLNKDSYKQVL